MKLALVVGHERRADVPGMRRDQEIVRTDGFPAGQ